MLNKLRAIRGKIKNNKLEKERLKYHAYLRSLGAKIGENVLIYPNTSTIDCQTPYLLEIGNNVCFSKNVTVLNHDYSISELGREFGSIVGSIAPVKIGNNVFVGINSTILKGVTIGDNCIIGANSLVTKSIPSGEVWGGNPARKICTTKELLERFESRQIEEAKTIAIEYYKRFNKVPPKELWYGLHYFHLWTPVSEYPDSVKNDYSRTNNPKLFEFMKSKKLSFNSYEDFIKSINF